MGVLAVDTIASATGEVLARLIHLGVGLLLHGHVRFVAHVCGLLLHAWLLHTGLLEFGVEEIAFSFFEVRAILSKFAVPLGGSLLAAHLLHWWLLLRSHHILLHAGLHARLLGKLLLLLGLLLALGGTTFGSRRVIEIALHVCATIGRVDPATLFAAAARPSAAP